MRQNGMNKLSTIFGFRVVISANAQGNFTQSFSQLRHQVDFYNCLKER